MRILSERVAAMKTIWTQSEASFEGEFVRFERIWSWPKPAQRPHPPVLIGGKGPTVLDRVLAYGDAWFPIYDPDDFDDMVARMQQLWAPAERPIDVIVSGVPPNPPVIERLWSEGCRRAVHWIPTGSRHVVEQALERWEIAIAEVTGER
jgi:hypothetical protein